MGHYTVRDGTEVVLEDMDCLNWLLRFIFYPSGNIFVKRGV